jgi:hypothetical protein
LELYGAKAVSSDIQGVEHNMQRNTGMAALALAIIVALAVVPSTGAEQITDNFTANTTDYEGIPIPEDEGLALEDSPTDPGGVDETGITNDTEEFVPPDDGMVDSVLPGDGDAVNTTANESGDTGDVTGLNETAFNETATADDPTPTALPANETVTEQAIENSTPVATEPVLPVLIDASETPEIGYMILWFADDSVSLEDGDCGHLSEGCQFMPSCDDGGMKTIRIVVILGADENPSFVSTVEASVSPPEEEVSPQDSAMTRIGAEDGTAMFSAATDAGLVTKLGTAPEFDRIISDLGAGNACVWSGSIELLSTAEPGDYVVNIRALDDDEETLLAAAGSFTYVPAGCCEFDFDHIEYGLVDADAFTDATGTYTVKNTGNVPLMLSVKQSVDAEWVVDFASRCGADGAEVIYGEEEWVTLPDALEKDTSTDLFFSIRVLRGSGTAAGNIWLSYQPA